MMRMGRGNKREEKEEGNEGEERGRERGKRGREGGREGGEGGRRKVMIGLVRMNVMMF